jgi:hypothetical protein
MDTKVTYLKSRPGLEIHLTRNATIMSFRLMINAFRASFERLPTVLVVTISQEIFRLKEEGEILSIRI